MSDQQGGPHKCPHCDRSFPNQHGLQVHLSRMHRDKFESIDKRTRRRKRHAAKAPGRMLPAPAAKVTTLTPAAINFCPHCGLPIAIVAQAMAIAKGVAGG